MNSVFRIIMLKIYHCVRICVYKYFKILKKILKSKLLLLYSISENEHSACTGSMCVSISIHPCNSWGGNDMLCHSVYRNQATLKLNAGFL